MNFITEGHLRGYLTYHPHLCKSKLRTRKVSICTWSDLPMVTQPRWQSRLKLCCFHTRDANIVLNFSPSITLPSLLLPSCHNRSFDASVCDFILTLACVLCIPSPLASSSSHIPFCPFPSRLPEREIHCLSFNLFCCAFLP